MDRITRSKQQKPISRKRKQEQMGKVWTKKKHCSDNGGIDKLPNDVLINILSRLSLKEAMRASVIARRWRYLWRFGYGNLRFDNRETVTGNIMERERLGSWLNKVVELHQAPYIEGMAICFYTELRDESGPITSSAIDSWVNFVMRKEVKRFELSLTFDYRYQIPNMVILARLEYGTVIYEFPSVERLISLSNGVITSPFCRLRTLRLDHVDIMDDVVHYFLANCPNLEELCIDFSLFTTNLRVVDPPKLRVLEIRRCAKIQSLEVSAVNLVSLSYHGLEKTLKLKNTPNLRELTISGGFSLSFVMNPEDHTSYSVQLEKLVLDFQFLVRIYISCDHHN